MKIIKSERAVAGEIFTSGFCNLNCSYCYIEKNDYLKKLHNSIIKKIQTGEYIEELKDLYGDQLESLAFWGTEPLLTIQTITPQIDKFLNTFSRLSSISFSTNLMINPESLIGFIKALPQDRKLTVKIQISIDGPSAITDKNRVGSATDTIKENFSKILLGLQLLDLKKTTIEFCFKPTWSIENLWWLLEKNDRLTHYFLFFENFIISTKFINTNKNIHLNLSGIPTMAVPGTYSVDDGIVFGVICRRLYNLGKTLFLKHQSPPFNSYVHRLIRLFDYGREFFMKPEMFSCSAGRSQSQLGEQQDLHLCHRSLFLNHIDYEKGLKDDGNWDFHLQQKDRIKLMKSKHIINIYDQYEVDRVFYNWAASQYFSKHKVATGLAIIKELVYSGQISRSFENEHLATIFSIFINYCLGCPAENILQTGSLYVAPVSLFRLFGWGAFETILKETKDVLSKRK